MVQVELGAKFVCWGKCEIGLCEIGDKRLGRCNVIFLKHKKKWMLGSNFNFGSMFKLLDHTIQLLDARK